MDLRLLDKAMAITDASRGIGRACAEAISSRSVARMSMPTS